MTLPRIADDEGDLGEPGGDSHVVASQPDELVARGGRDGGDQSAAPLDARVHELEQLLVRRRGTMTEKPLVGALLRQPVEQILECVLVRKPNARIETLVSSSSATVTGCSSGGSARGTA